MKTNNAKRVLELGAGHGRDTIFFASNALEVEALDYSSIAVEILDKIRMEKRLPIKPQFFDVKNPLPFPDGYFQRKERESVHIWKQNYGNVMISYL